MLLHVFPSMSASSLREFPENCFYRHGGQNIPQNIYDHQFVNVTDIHRKQDLVNLNFMDKTINEMSIILMFFFVLV